MSSPACDVAWRRFTTKRFSCNGSVWAGTVAQSFSSVHTVIAGIATVVPDAAHRHVSNNGGAPTADISKAGKDDSIIAIDSAIIGDGAARNPA